MRRKGFTLVELLVVIGIIAVLIAILMPALSRAREQAQRVQCMSNMRQLGMAMMMYVQDNKGSFPFAAVAPLPEDWIYWHAGRNRNESPLVKYHGGHFVENLYRCPSDVIQNRRTMTPGLDFSYTVNWNICCYTGRGLPAAMYPPRIAKIVNSSLTRDAGPQDKPARRLRILVVGDERRQRGALALYVTSGWDVQFATDLQGTVEALREVRSLDAVIAEHDAADERWQPVLTEARRIQPNARRIVRGLKNGPVPEAPLVHRFVERDAGLDALLDALTADITQA